MEEKMLVVEEKAEEVPAEKAVEIVEPKPVTGSLEGLKNLFALAIPNQSSGTKAHNPSKKGGKGITRKNKEQGKKSAKISKNSRKKNRGK